MSHLAKLIPKHRPRLEALGKSAWELFVPPYLSNTGKEQRLFFRTKKEAADKAAGLKTRQDGHSLSGLTPVRIHEAAEAFRLLEGTDLRLLDIVRTALKGNSDYASLC
jgi:hypothetical protein